MRSSHIAIALLVGTAAAVPLTARAQVTVDLHLGPPLVVTHYAPEVYGDWHTRYQYWTPVTVYAYQGNWYSRPVTGARQVVVYRSSNRYFLPPQDPAWDKKDKRYKYQWRPNDDDYKHAVPPGLAKPKPGKGRGRGHG
jgi:hypothetical protein